MLLGATPSFRHQSGILVSDPGPSRISPWMMQNRGPSFASRCSWDPAYPLNPVSWWVWEVRTVEKSMDWFIHIKTNRHSDIRQWTYTPSTGPTSMRYYEVWFAMPLIVFLGGSNPRNFCSSLGIPISIISVVLKPQISQHTVNDRNPAPAKGWLKHVETLYPLYLKAATSR